MIPDTPYYAVIFKAEQHDEEGYAAAVERMVELAEKQAGFLGIDHARSDDGFELTVSYWTDEEAIRNWRTNVEHLEAQKIGRQRWFRRFAIHVARVERSYEFRRER